MSPPRGVAPQDLNSLTLPRLYESLAAGGLVRRLIELARDEDLGPALPTRTNDPEAARGGLDITTAASIHPDVRAEARVDFRAEGIVAGLAALPDLLAVFAPMCRAEMMKHDGDRVNAGEAVAVVRGPLDEILELERTMLNLLSRLSGVATRTAEFVKAIAPGSRARLFDTRKTTPGMRMLEKYAVRCGGGFCHRVGLYDAVLLKDNHLAALGASPTTDALRRFVAAAAANARAISRTPLAFIEVEVDTLDQLRALLELPEGTIDIILLDNMGPPLLTEACAARDGMRPHLQLEASGGITLETIGAISRTGVDRISTGSITHSAPALDIGLDIG